MQQTEPALPWFYSWPGTIFKSLTGGAVHSQDIMFPRHLHCEVLIDACINILGNGKLDDCHQRKRQGNVHSVEYL